MSPSNTRLTIEYALIILFIVLVWFVTGPPQGPTPAIVAGAPPGWAVYGEAPHEYYLREGDGQLELDLPLPVMPALGPVLREPTG